MKLFFILCLLFSFSVCAAFINGSDIPLMEGLIVDEESSFSFDSPEGQIMTINAQTSATPKEISQFYKESLTELGWKRKTLEAYYRDQDKLFFRFSRQNKVTKVRIQLTLANK